MPIIPKTGEVKLKGDLAKNILFVVERGDWILTQPYNVCTYEIIPREGTYLAIIDPKHKRDKILKVSSENGKLTSSEIDEMEPEIDFSHGGLYQGKTTITMKKRMGEGPDIKCQVLEGEIPSEFLPKNDITCLDDVIDFMETTISGVIPYNRGNLGKDLTVDRFLSEGGVCAHFAQFLSKALDEEYIKNAVISGFGLNTVEDGVKYYSTLADGETAGHGFVEAKFGDYYWLDPTRWAAVSRDGHGKKKILGHLRRAGVAKVKDAVFEGITSPNLFEHWRGPRISLDDDLNMYYVDSIEIVPQIRVQSL